MDNLSSKKVEEILVLLGSNIKQGLSSEEARKRFQQ
jgi:hypothetical protein